MKHAVAMAILSTACLFTTFAKAKEQSAKAEMHHGEMNHHGMHHAYKGHGEHAHKPIDVKQWQQTPSLSLTAEKDLVAGWNLYIEATNFEFTPNKVNLENNENEGHGHIYINGKKHTRLYSSWFYLNNLPKGKHSITVTLNANDHGPLMLNDKLISASIEVVQE